MLIYTTKNTNRLKYTLDLIFNDILGLNYFICTKLDEFRQSDQPKINYSNSPVTGAINISPSNLLFSDAISIADPDVDSDKQGIKIFKTEGELGFDIFSAVFFMVSRFEEYSNKKLDEFDRFPAVESFAYKNGFLDKPVVNIWVNILKAEILKSHPLMQFSTPKFESLMTYDIDVAYKYRGRPLIKNLVLLVKDVVLFRFYTLQTRFKVLTNKISDPWDVYTSLKSQLEKNRLSSIFFFLSGPYSKHNKNLPPSNKLQVQLVDTIDQWTKIGIHPSYESYLNPIKIGKEKAELEKITRKPIIRSRQHYLRLQLPETYRYLLEVGIKEDYTMGFADRAGFRAGICTPFYFYDLKSEMVTDLKIYPITYMDGSLLKYEKLSVDNAIQKVKKLIDEVKDVNGQFISLWHNHTLSNDKEFKGWNDVHTYMIKELSNSSSL